MPKGSIPTGRDTSDDYKVTRSDGFSGNRAQSVGSQRDISAEVEKEQRSSSARNGRARQ